jgi:hypothetical protein
VNVTIELVGICVVVPALIAALVMGGALRFDSARLAERFAVPCAVATAFIAAYVLLPEWAALSPDRHWHWLPYLAATAALVGPAGVSAARRPWLHWVALVVLSIGAAFLLVPNWETLRPARPVSMGLLAAYLGILMLVLDEFAMRVSRGKLLAALALTGFLLAGVLADGSFRYAELAAIAAAAFAGCWLIAAFTNRHRALDLRGAAPIYGVLVAAWHMWAASSRKSRRGGCCLFP